MTKFAFHIHHSEWLVEPLVEPTENRLAFIRKHKSAHEQALRERLLKPVRGKLPEAVLQAGAAWRDAWDAMVMTAWAPRATFDAASIAYSKARAVYRHALSDHRAEIEALHAAECPDCPWDGYTIFPEGGGQ